MAVDQNYAMQLRQVELERKRLENELKKAQMPSVKEQAKLDAAKKSRTEDLAAGRARGEEMFGKTYSEQDPAIAKRLIDQAEGFTPEEMSALRDQNMKTVGQSNQANLRQLRIQQAAEGVRGGQAAAQRAKMLNDQGGQMVESERDLFLKNIDARRTGLTQLQDAANREKQAILTTEMGYGSLGAADRGAVMQAMVGEAQAKAAKGGGGGKK